MKNLISFITTEPLLFLGYMVVLVTITVVIINMVMKSVSRKKEEKLKLEAKLLGVENVNKLFKVAGVDLEKKVILLRNDPEVSHPSGLGEGVWYKTDNISKELIRKNQVLLVTLQSKDEVLIVGHDSF